MFDPRQINDIVNRLLGSIPPGVKNLPKDLEKNFKSILQQSFSKMDLVTREEFDAQVKVLERTRGKLEALEKKLSELENLQS
ncbi:accessory factor UbiK family protein [Coxiella endosymbiont of Ornithodoros amblus]|uniref:accessory factor UbiK family protein n=1 Tax=Coxiella endosymbiont of Ornithodoros amblus TaxID=1656166 RepID=UPI00244E10A6|nr:accessory factor UbiK family protein [Coxiella endosymbiont of Ornithodoros amblus]MBW5802789.1 accessory factor UbiK family protein [Coxiella endosymbiont of Ornithodoros amblus]